MNKLPLQDELRAQEELLNAANPPSICLYARVADPPARPPTARRPRAIQRTASLGLSHTMEKQPTR
eukprot:359937-Chlamydomonas_euryale.AAC.24